jgi:hypothetical protein
MNRPRETAEDSDVVWREPDQPMVRRRTWCGSWTIGDISGRKLEIRADRFSGARVRLHSWRKFYFALRAPPVASVDSSCNKRRFLAVPQR